MAEVVEKKTHYVIIETNPTSVEVQKMVSTDEGWVKEASYTVADSKTCTCKRFQFKGICKHLSFVSGKGLETKGISLAEARKVAAEVIEYIREDFSWVGLDDGEPYVRDAAGTVTGIQIDAVSKILPDSARVNVLVDGTVVRFHLISAKKER